MRYLLNLIYFAVLVAVAPWLVYRAVRQGKYREGYAEKLVGKVPRRSSDRPCLWFHAVSVGEVNLLAPLIRRIEQQHPDWQCVVSTTTRTGMALARKKYPGLSVFYCPLDFSWATARAMRRVRPDVLVLAELELWPNLIAAAKRAGAKVAVINGRLSENSYAGYRRIRPLLARLLGRLDLVAAQDATYAERFLALGARRSSVQSTGSMKYDGAVTDRQNRETQRLRELAGFADNDIVVLAGSTQEPEEEAAVEVFRRLSPRWPRLRLVLVPRHPERFEAVARMLDASGIAWQRRTELSHEEASVGAKSSARVLLVDVVGELGAWWGTAHIAFVGGSLGRRGGQNMIEPAAYGAAVSFGPNTRNFRDIVSAMLRRDAAVVVADVDALARFVANCLEHPKEAAALGRRAQELVLEQLGATERTLSLLEHLVPDIAEPSRELAA